MKTIKTWCAVFGGIASLLINCPSICGAADDWRYEALARDKTIKANTIKSPSGDELLVFKSIDVGGFKTARFFVQVTPSDNDKNQGKFTQSAKLRVACFHNIKGGPSHYFEKEILMEFTTHISGWVEIPIIGDDMRIVVWGDNLPKLEMKADCTIYLLK